MMPWWPQDFLAATAHWTSAQRGAYATLLMYEWVLDGLPTDLEELARLCNEPLESFHLLWVRVGKKFVAADGVYRNLRLEEHRANAIKARDARAKGAYASNASQRAKRLAQRALSEQSAQESAHAEHSAQATHPYPYPYPNLEEKKPPTPFTLSERSASRPAESPAEAMANDAWREVEGLNADAFEAYLSHLDVLVAQGQVRATLAPHSRIAQAKWLAGQGGWSRQQEIVTRAIRNGWKTLERAETRSGRRSFDDLHKES